MSKHNWIELETRWLSGEWLTFKKMSEATGIGLRVLYLKSHAQKWAVKKKAAVAEAVEAAKDHAVKNLSERLIEANERALKNAEILLKLGMNKFITRDEEGKLRFIPIEKESTALNAIKSAIQIEQAVLRKQPINSILEGESFAQIDENGIEELSDADLDRIINAANKAIAANVGNATRKAAKARKKSSRRKEKKKRGKK